MKKKIYLLGGILLTIIIAFSCSSENSPSTENTPTLPIISTLTVTKSGTTTASSGGNISSDGGENITSRGVVWNTSQNPTIVNSKTIDGIGIGNFNSAITGLLANTTYYFRAYATNSVGTAYGNEITYITSAISTLPTLTTSSISNITASTAISGGNITSDGGSTIINRGIAWSINQNPIVTNSKTINGNGVGVFSSSITNLTANTTYYIRAYATNSIGTAYGSQVSFTTTSNSIATTVTDIDGNIYPTILICSQLWMKKNLNVSKYRNGDLIPQVQDATQWNNLTTGAWCYYANQTANGTVYGKLYNWYAVNDSRGLAPAGWHIPSNNEWVTLENCLGGWASAGFKMKEIGTAHWQPTNDGATNSSDFTGIPGGLRISNPGTVDFSQINYEGFWWSTSESSDYYGKTCRILNSDVGYLGTSAVDLIQGLSVRCLKD
ncbi:fibrobacter succinogenes major paralogous domain-containing protein [Flavobacterium gawalongense]|uniref:Fibronectin type-III domain-containing protein n=1 Tax=Flavobacterium gawalongense TaxID=2594432 RepID=A0A553B9S5_9FLAO|nr:fibrobacter succinogenes major paralogous domain-containing protein [Flavobacterium gawalongense]TRW96441.1 hypothetical protein FNW33_17130 [Flavobacterium gawalongense]TRX01183.1 hypothetical protein FNW12_17265 [Flavobacterium gawalongense]TRX04999.1 hypothetical protein FNW11_16790 [Flavobacterium gawalongense]TRX05803.1 hypothetical protein FNW10_16760 [Flavobacterium gawalongense]TRX21497.1 hypothetical protein FNW38_16885 [Flavobacterium gawalongense]